MPRIPRVVVPGLPHHLTQRGNNRMMVFLDDQDFEKCKALVQRGSALAGCAIHSYVLMGNHFHLLATPDEPDSVARMMQSVEMKYVQYFNDRYERIGTLWQGRFNSTVVESDRYFLTCGRYVELNPVRALLAEHPAHYRWSSFQGNASGVADPLLTPHPLYTAMGRDETARKHAYVSLFAGHLDLEACEAIRKATRLRRVLGSEQFEREVEALLNRPVRPGAHGGDRRSPRFSGTP